jgi:predicted membrane protein
MDSLPAWAWWIIVAGVLLSPVFAFLIALLIEILIGVLKEAGIPAVLALVAAGVIGRLLFRMFWQRHRPSDFVGDQA